jgi:segregation and condensation protein A
MSYAVKLDTFEGPLDLLLHLISKAKVKIEDISITQITQQYLEHLDTMQQFNIEIASEFLVMAATLLYIKSCTLLPKVKVESDADEDEPDPRQELIARLIEYKRYKEAGEMLGKRKSVYDGIYSKLPEEYISGSDSRELILDADINDLCHAFLKVIHNKGMHIKQATVHKISREPITLGQRMAQLLNILEIESKISFFGLFTPMDERSDIILTFLALLEMLKDNRIKLIQDGLFDDIIIIRSNN